MVYEKIGNLRGPAGYNATGAAEDAAALAAFTRETAGPNEFANALGEMTATEIGTKGSPAETVLSATYVTAVVDETGGVTLYQNGIEL
jgi:hypothetical protein